MKLRADKKFESVPSVKNWELQGKTLIFDLDGTMANTEPYHWRAHRKVFAEYGIELTNDDIEKYIGHNDMQIYTMAGEDYGIDFDVKQCSEDKVREFLRINKDIVIPMYEEIREAILASNDNYIITSQKREIVDMLLKRWGINDKFKKIVSLYDTGNSKIETFYKLDIPKESVVWFEDSFHTVMEIIGEGIKCVQVL